MPRTYLQGQAKAAIQQRIRDYSKTDGEVHPGELVPVPASWFEMGRPDPDTGRDDEIPVHYVYLDAYQIGKYEVTNQEYADVLNWAHGRGYLTNHSGGTYTGGLIYGYGQPLADTVGYSQISYSGGSGGWFGVCSQEGYGGQEFSMAYHPMGTITWYGAVSYCNWLSEQQGLQPCYDASNWTRYEPVRNGYRLPTEAEWERAAAWDRSKHWRYGMTSDIIDITYGNYGYNTYANPLDLYDWPYTTPVGWYNGVNPAQLSVPGTLTVNAMSPVGAYDMSGNVIEWCHDWYDPSYYSVGSMTNPTGPSSGSEAVARGGTWSTGYGEYFCRTATRYHFTLKAGNSLLGFRVARTP